MSAVVDPFAGCATIPEADTILRELIAAGIGEHGHAWAFGKDVQAIGYRHTAALTRITDDGRPAAERTPGTAPKAKRAPARRTEQRAEYNPDGTITCVGPCGETKPDKKFPTMKGGAARADMCRTCRDAAIVERKACVR